MRALTSLGRENIIWVSFPSSHMNTTQLLQKFYDTLTKSITKGLKKRTVDTASTSMLLSGASKTPEPSSMLLVYSVSSTNR
jgi:hypothetical protein